MPTLSESPPIRYSTRVQADWLDYNGHMNVAYYTLAFDQAGEAFFSQFGLSEIHAEKTGNSWVVLEAHITYQQEAMPDDELEIHSRILGLSGKRLQLFQTMRRKTDDALLASNEQMILHVNLRQRQSVPFTAPVMERLKTLYERQRHLEHPAEAGRRIDMDAKRPRP
jgi:acyl-CoA thioester hydrolase